MNHDESFTLKNDPPVPRPAQFEDNASRQRLLLTGLDCLAGQLDLIPTDGEDDAPTQPNDG